MRREWKCLAVNKLPLALSMALDTYWTGKRSASALLLQTNRSLRCWLRFRARRQGFIHVKENTDAMPWIVLGFSQVLDRVVVIISTGMHSMSKHLIVTEKMTRSWRTRSGHSSHGNGKAKSENQSFRFHLSLAKKTRLDHSTNPWKSPTGDYLEIKMEHWKPIIQQTIKIKTAGKLKATEKTTVHSISL